MLEFPYNSAWKASASRKQGYKKVAFPLITPTWGSLWSIFLVPKFLLDCSEISENMEMLLHSISGKLLEERKEHHNLPAILTCPFHLPLVLTFFFFFFSYLAFTIPDGMSILFFWWGEQGGVTMRPLLHLEVCLWPRHNWSVNCIPLVGLGISCWSIQG